MKSKPVTRLDRREFLAVSGGTLTSLASGPTFAKSASSKPHGLIVGHPEGAEAGMRILAKGGNAIDAVVAGALVAGVVAVSRCGISGYGGHMSIGLPGGKVTCIDFNSEAPAAARPDMFSLDAKGNVEGGVNMHGWLSAGVPATLAGLQFALTKYGTLPFADLVQPAIHYARDGFRVYWPFSNTLRLDPGSAKLFMKNGKPLAKDSLYRNPDLADVLEKLAEQGSVHDFYRGEIARKIAAAFKKNGGLVTSDDMAAYQPLELAPLTMEWHDHTIATAPLTAGGLTILQIIATLKALETDSQERLPMPSPVFTHARLEAMRIAWGDRLKYFGDPRHVDVPVKRLLSDGYARESAKKVFLAAEQKKPVPVTTDGRTQDGTVNLSVVDGNGMMVAVTLTHGNSFGAQVTVDGLGLLLGHGMSRFDPVPGQPNSIAPGKRPLDNMSPTIVLSDGKPVMALGAVGGRRIPNAVFHVLSNVIAEGRDLPSAVEAPRLHTVGGMLVNADPGWPDAELKYLKQIGYKVLGPQQGWVGAVRIDPAKDRNGLVGAADEPPPEHTRETRARKPSVVRAG